MGYDPSELAAIGERFNTESLLEWSGQIAQAAYQDAARLKARGITQKILADIEESRQEVKKLGVAREREKKGVSTRTLSHGQALEPALDWREEIKGLAEAIFDSEPETLARFRTGVKVSHSIPKLISEIGILLGTVREHLPALKGVGADEELVKRGEAALAALEEARLRQKEEESRTPEPALQFHQAQGVLYTRTRFVTRIAEVEFRNEPSRLPRYSYAPLRRPEAAVDVRRGRQPKPVPTRS